MPGVTTKANFVSLQGFVVSPCFTKVNFALYPSVFLTLFWEFTYYFRFCFSSVKYIQLWFSLKQYYILFAYLYHVVMLSCLDVFISVIPYYRLLVVNMLISLRQEMI